MTPNPEDEPNQESPAPPAAPAFDETARLVLEREIEARLDNRLRMATGFYNKFLYVGLFILLIAVAYWLLAPRRASAPKVADAPPEVSAQVKAITEQMKAFNQEYARFQDSHEQFEKTYKQFQTGYDQFQAACAEVTNRVAQLKEIDAQIASLNVTTNLQRVDAQLEILESIRNKSQKLFEDVSELNDFYLALSTLRPDENNRIDRTALDPLRRIAQDRNNNLALSAQAAIRTVANSLESERQTYLNTGPMMPFNTNTITFDQTMGILKRQTDPFRIVKLVTFMGTNPNFPKTQRMDFLMDLYDHSTNLLEVYVAELAIKSEAKLQDLPPFSFEQVHDWWKQNQSSSAPR